MTNKPQSQPTQIISGQESTQQVQMAQQQKDLAEMQSMQRPLVQENVAIINGQQAMQQASTVQQQTKVDDPSIIYPGVTIKPEGVTILLFGALGTWKTTWAGMWPKPLILSIGPEGGDDSLAMLPSLYGIPVPPVFKISCTEDMRSKVAAIVRNYKRWDINTVVIDSLTYYFDMWVYDLLRQRYPSISVNKLETMGWAATMHQRDWGLVATHLNDIALQLHKLGINIIWTTLEKEITVPDNDGNRRVVGRQPYLKGEMALKIPGMCKMIINAQKTFKANPQNPTMMYTQPVFYTSPTMYTKDWVRHKYGNAFPEGKLVDPELGDLPTFRALYNRIGNFVYMT